MLNTGHFYFALTGQQLSCQQFLAMNVFNKQNCLFLQQINCPLCPAGKAADLRNRLAAEGVESGHPLHTRPACASRGIYTSLVSMMKPDRLLAPCGLCPSALAYGMKKRTI
jgi:hypothetical protein